MIFLKVVTTHVTYVSYQAQLEIYTLWECQKREKIRFREKNLNLNPKSGLKKNWNSRQNSKSRILDLDLKIQILPMCLQMVTLHTCWLSISELAH